GKAPRRLGPENIRIDGGRRVTGIRAVEVRLELAEDPDLDDLMRVRVDRAGDTSTYTLSVVAQGAHGRPGPRPHRGFRLRSASTPFSFRTACPADMDCADSQPCPPRPRPAPVIDYTARDYPRLRRLLLDRMTLTMPNWRERHAPDLGITLVEL